MNDFNLVDWRRKQNIQSVIIPNKKQLFWDLMNIEHSWTGRLDTNISNAFIMEAEQLLINSIELFEYGYFDCAYYSLRSSVDVSTTMVFLADLPDDDRESYLNDWKSTSIFPQQGQLVKQLSKNGNVFIDMKEKIPDFFLSAKQLEAELNKYVHKQGLQHFYVSRNHPLNQNKSQETFIDTFISYLNKCIGVVAVMRLAIDPFPILLMDDEILYRCFDSMTEPYTQEFVDKYIGKSIIDQYKQTEMYLQTYNSFILEEKKNKATFDVFKYKYINTNSFDDIEKQLHLLPTDDLISVFIVSSCAKATKIYTNNGMSMYFTDRNTNRTAMSWSGLDFKNFANTTPHQNIPYDEAFITVFQFNDKYYFMEHNELLTEDEVAQVTKYVSEKIKP